jgi:hypothetical protein
MPQQAVRALALTIHHRQYPDPILDSTRLERQRRVEGDRRIHPAADQCLQCSVDGDLVDLDCEMAAAGGPSGDRYLRRSRTTSTASATSSMPPAEC